MIGPLSLQTVLTMIAIGVTIVSMILVNRNARRATSVQAENRDLARIRDLRAELAETERKMAEVKARATEAEEQADQLDRQLQEANRRGRIAQAEAAQAWTELAELKRLAHQPGMTIERFREYVGPVPEVPGNGDRA